VPTGRSTRISAPHRRATGMSSEQRRGLLWALGAAVGIAAFNIPWKLASEHGSAAANALLLLCAAALFNTLLTAIQRRALPRFDGLALKVAAALACLTLAGNMLSALAIQTLSPALLTVTQRSEIILVALLAWPFVGERVDRPFWFGAGIAGVGLVILHDPGGVADARAMGVMWGLLSAVCFAGMAVLTRRYVHRIDVIAVNGLRLWLAVLLWFTVGDTQAVLGEITPAQAGYTCMAAFFGPFAGRLCMMTSARYLEARITTLMTLAAPPLALLLAFLVLGDLPGPRDLVGGAVILAGIALPILARARRRR
jgi:drug/metabolite transporter (DMT)-like permease